MKRYKKAAGILAVLLAAVLCGGCMSTTMQKTGEQSTEVESENSGVEKEEKPEINEIHLRDKDTLYESDDDTSVVTMYLTVSRGNSSENTDHSWSEINSYSAYDY